jgi:hypothetical protein
VIKKREIIMPYTNTGSHNYSYASGSSAATSGPKTPQGRAIAARNATSHGLFARDIVLPQLGEDPEGYNSLFLTLCEQIEPENLLERHYVEEIAAASWRLRRLHRWQAQVYENPALTEDERLDKLDKVLRHETALHRQIDKSVRMLAREVPQVFEGRARKLALEKLDQTERLCRLDEDAELEVARTTRDYLQCTPVTLDKTTLDNTHPVPEPVLTAEEQEKCQNELAAQEAAEEQAKEKAIARAIDASADKQFNADPPLPMDYVHGDGRPGYIQPSQWRYMAEMRASGQEQVAQNIDAYWQRTHLAKLEKANA